MRCLEGRGVCIAVNLEVGCCGCQVVCDCCGLAVCQFSLLHGCHSRSLSLWTTPSTTIWRSKSRLAPPGFSQPTPKDALCLRVVKSPRDNPSPFDVAWLIGVLSLQATAELWSPSVGWHPAVGRTTSIRPVSVTCGLWVAGLAFLLASCLSTWSYDFSIHPDFDNGDVD